MIDISGLKDKIENKGATAKGRLSADEFNTLVSAVEENQDDKIGYQRFYSEESLYRYFADEENADLYDSDPQTYADLVLAQHEGQNPYYATITLKSSQSVGVLSGTTGNYIKFTFDIKNSRTNQSTGEGVYITIQNTNGSTVVSKSLSKSYGEEVDQLVDEMLLEGTNVFTISVQGKTHTTAETQTVVTYSVYALSLATDGFDFSTPKSGTLSIPYQVSATPVKYIEWYIDGEKVGADDVEQNPSAERTKSISLSSYAEGKHYLEIRMYILHNTDTKFYSSTIHHDFLIGSPTGVFTLVSATLGQGVLSDTSEINITGTQYETFSLQYAIYDSQERTLGVSVKYGDETIQQVTKSNYEIESFSYTPNESGTKTLAITCGDATSTINVSIASSSIGMNETTDELVLRLKANGRSNSEINPDTWTYGNYSTTFSNVKFDSTDGWQDGALVLKDGGTIDIDIAPFATNPLTNGKTIEIDFSTDDVEDDDAVVCSCVNSSGVGLKITASEATLASSGTTPKTTSSKYKPRERTKIAFVINKLTGTTYKGFIYLINNGVLCFPDVCEDTDTFVNGGAHLTFGNADGDATIKIYSIRVYDKALSNDEELANYAIDSTSPASIASSNDVYTSGTTKISVEKAQNILPTLLITCADFQTILDTTSTSTSVNGSLIYTHPTDETLNFTASSCRIRKQGTSSASYPKPNLRTDRYSGLLDYQGNNLGSAYAFKHGSCPCTIHTWKTDFMESSMSHNTGIARLWNDIMKYVQIDNEYVCRTNAQAQAESVSHPYDIRTTIDGFPALIFYRTSTTSEPVFLGLYNFNNDKSSLGVFGWDTSTYKISGYDPSNTECWELKEETGMCNYEGIADFDKNWSTYFEGRQPDGNTNTTNLKSFVTWVNNTKVVTGFNDDGSFIIDSDKLAKWKEEKSSHIDEWKMAAYYIYIMYFCAVDQVAKNAMLTTEDKTHWFFINYDNDTTLGLNNEGYLKFAYDLVRSTITNDSTASYLYGYQGHENILFNNFEADDTDEYDSDGNVTYLSFMSKVKQLANAMYQTSMASLSYDNCIDMFVDKQSKQFCERYHNASQQYKYFDSYLADQKYLYACQGTRESHLRYFLSKRVDLFESMWAFGSYISKAVEMKFSGVDVEGGNDKITITSGYPHYYGWRSNKTNRSVSVFVDKGESHTFETGEISGGDIIYALGANNMQAFDISTFVENLMTIDFSSAYDATTGARMKRILLSSNDFGTTRYNTQLTAISGLANLTTLEEIDITGFKNLTNINSSLSTLVNLKKFYAYNSGITSFQPASGVQLTEVVLPEGLNSLVLDGGSVTTLTYTPTSALRVISIKGTSGINTYTFMKTWTSKITDYSTAQVTLTGINWSGVDVGWLISLKQSFVDAGRAEYLTLAGYIKLSSMTYAQYLKIIELFGNNVFTTESTLRIDAPSAVYINIDKSALSSGSTAQLSVVVFPIGSSSEVLYRMYNPSGVQVESYAGVSINSSTGLITASDNLTEDTFTLQFDAYSSVAGSSDKVSLYVSKLYYAESFTYDSSKLSLIPTSTEYTSFNLGVSWNSKVNLPAYDAVLNTSEGDASKCEIVTTDDGYFSDLKIYYKKVDGNYSDISDSYTISWHSGTGSLLKTYSQTIVVTTKMVKVSSITIQGSSQATSLGQVLTYNVYFLPTNHNVAVSDWDVTIGEGS